MNVSSYAHAWLEDPGEEFQGLNMKSLGIDQAYFVGTSDRTVGVYIVSNECFRCPYQLQKNLTGLKKEHWVVNTRVPSTWRVYENVSQKFIRYRNSTGLVCQLSPEVGEFGVYNLKVSGQKCSLETAKEPVNIYAPLLLLLGVLTAVWVLYGFGKLVMSRIRETGKLRNGAKELAIEQRLRALDTLRGIIIVIMIFIHFGHGQYNCLGLATWNGLRLANFMWPTFHCIMGACIPLKIGSAVAKGMPRWKICFYIFRRSLSLFVLGLMVNLQAFGALQRLSVAYLIAAGFYALTVPKYYTPPRGAYGAIFKDVLACVRYWLLAGVLITVHSVITFTVHAPSCPAGYLGPGGMYDDWAAPNCAGGASGYIGQLLLSGTIINSKRSSTGLLGYLTSVAQTLLGLQGGVTFLMHRSHKSRVCRWLAWAAVLALAGGLLAGFSTNQGLVPINWSLGSVSFVFVTTAAWFVALSICYMFTDAWGLWSGFPFRAPGLNSITIYVAHNVCRHNFPFYWKSPLRVTHGTRLAEAVWGTALWVIIAHVMAKKKVFITV